MEKTTLSKVMGVLGVGLQGAEAANYITGYSLLWPTVCAWQVTFLLLPPASIPGIQAQNQEDWCLSVISPMVITDLGIIEPDLLNHSNVATVILHVVRVEGCIEFRGTAGVQATPST